MGGGQADQQKHPEFLASSMSTMGEPEGSGMQASELGHLGCQSGELGDSEWEAGASESPLHLACKAVVVRAGSEHLQRWPIKVTWKNPQSIVPLAKK